ncbi:MAG: hypothetical protein HN337_03560 [Deltaproteobacteria bacterium]|jgi:hypothetical protein|nr:hypothetical protein [Deltaproteobacteria bacterium]
MKKLSSIFSFKNLPYTLIVVIVVVFASQQLLTRSTAYWTYLYKNSNPKFDDGLRFAAVANGIDKNKKKALIMGASQARENVDIGALNNSFSNEDITFYNLGISQGQAVDFFMTKNLVMNTNPDLIIFVGDLNMISSPYMFTKLRLYFHPSIIYQWIEILGWRYLWEHKKETLHAFLGYIFPVYQFRESFGRILQNELAINILNKKRKPFKRFAYSGMRRKTIYEDLDNTLQSDKTDDIASPEEIAMNEALFERFIEGITDRGIPFIMIDAPYYKNAKETYFGEIYPGYDKYINSLSKRYNFSYYSDADTPIFDKEDFVDHTHLNAAGRRKFTTFLTEIADELFFDSHNNIQD